MAVVGNPLNQADVQRALGVGSSVNKWSQLCTHANINKWNAYKPIYHSKITRLTDAERAAGRTVSGYLVSWGMMKRISSAWSDFMDNYGEIKSFPWIYDKPVWDGTSKFRITDFIGYNSDVRRLVAVSFSSWDLWLPSATGSVGYSLWAQLTGLSTVSSQNTGAMRWQELFGNCLNYYPTLIMTAGTNYVYAKSSDYTIQDLINRGDTGATIYVNTATLADAMIRDGSAYDVYPLNDNALWRMTMVLCSSKITGEAASISHHIPSGANILRLEYESGADRTTKNAKLLKHKAFSSMSAKVTLEKVSGYSYRYRLSKIELTAEKLTEDAVSFTCNFSLSAQVGTVYVYNEGSATGGQALTVNNYLGPTINFAADETGTITKTWQYGSTSGNALPETYWDITQAQTGSNQRLSTGHLYFTSPIGTFDNGWGDIDVSGQSYRYTREFTLF